MIEYEDLRKVNQPFREELKKAFNQVLDSGWFVLGKNVEEFEKEFAQYIGVNHCAGVASGLDALTIALMTLDIPKGSEVIVPSNTYIASIISILNSGNVPVLVEPDMKTYNIDPSKIEEIITTKTRAIMVVHLYGKPCDMDPIMDICKKHNLFLIEDCAQSHGAEYKGRKTGTFGDISAFSFYPTKNLGGLGDGGALVTNNKDYYLKTRKLRNYGSEKKYYNEYLGINSRLDEIQAAFLRVKLKHLNSINNHKRDLAGIYFRELNKNIVMPVSNEFYYDVFHIFNIRLKHRDLLKNYLLENGVKTEIHYPVPPHKQQALQFLNNLNFPISEEIHSTTLSLPLSFAHNEEDIYRVVGLINRFLEKN